VSESRIEAIPSLVLGRYRVLHHLASGGMGQVLLARIDGEAGFSRPVVLKVMRPEMAVSEEGSRLFQREAQILSRLQHPAIPNILDFGIENGAHIMVLEYVHGYSMASWLNYRFATKRHIPVDVCLAVVRRVLDALGYAHHLEMTDSTETEIVHRDVSPDNILVDRKGYAYLVDFGIASVNAHNRARSTVSGVFRGKLGYAAPELLRGEPATASCDQYSAAVTLLEMLTLELPFHATTPAETLHRMATEMPQPPSLFRPDIPAGLDGVLMKALAKYPAERFDSVHEFARALARFQRMHDEEVAHELRGIVERDFEELPAVLSIEPLSQRETAFERGAGTISLSVPASAAPERRRRALWYWLVPSIVGLALVVALAVSLGKRRPSQVVVVGGKQSELPLPEAIPMGNDASPPAPVELETTLGQALSREGKQFESCFARHVDLAEKMPEAMLRFSVKPRSPHAQVSIQPEALSKSALGACLRTAAETITLPLQDKALSFRVPVRAKFDAAP
jgi:serine/threonine protein kinase